MPDYKDDRMRYQKYSNNSNNIMTVTKKGDHLVDIHINLHLTDQYLLSAVCYTTIYKLPADKHKTF